MGGETELLDVEWGPSLSCPYLVLLPLGKQFLDKKTRAMSSEKQGVEEVCAQREAELNRLHRAQRETLELELSWLPEPRIKHTRRFFELQKTKSG